jgi:hypothetical protein
MHSLRNKNFEIEKKAYYDASIGRIVALSRSHEQNHNLSFRNSVMPSWGDHRLFHRVVSGSHMDVFRGLGSSSDGTQWDREHPINWISSFWDHARTRTWLF